MTAASGEVPDWLCRQRHVGLSVRGGTDMKRPVKAMVPLVDGMVEPQRGLHAEAHEHAYGLTSRAGGGDRAARGVARRAGTQWIGWPPH
jgi:hypothetical protein